jgi:hypothetical protein
MTWWHTFGTQEYNEVNEFSERIVHTFISIYISIYIYVQITLIIIHTFYILFRHLSNFFDFNSSPALKSISNTQKTSLREEEGMFVSLAQQILTLLENFGCAM